MALNILDQLTKKGAPKTAHKALDSIFEAVSSSPSIALSQLVVDNAVLIVVDMVNGFVKNGPLASPNTAAINDKIAALVKACEQSGIPVAALADCHTLSSPEFSSFPAHCLEGSEETEITDEIAAFRSVCRIEKNSTNGFLEQDFKTWIKANGSGTYIIVGCCTDLCVQQLATTLKTYFDQSNRVCRIVVPADLVSTYDLGFHDSALTGIMALYNMSLNGIEICSGIEY